MKRDRFTTFLEDNILSMFTGSEIAGEEESSPRDACVAQGAAGSLLVKFDRSDDYRFVIRRVQPFKAFEISIIKSILEEMHHIYRANLDKEYVNKLETQVAQHAICKVIAAKGRDTLDSLLTLISSWALRTYEGNRATFGFVVSNKTAPKNINPNMHIEHILRKDFIALLSDGKNTGIELSADGYLVGYQTFSNAKKEDLLAPFEYLKLASQCTGTKVGVCLNEQGDVLLFKDKQLLFAKRNGAWVCFSHEEIIGKLADRTGEVEELRRAIYLSALDTSFARNGGCILHVNNSERFSVLKHIDAADLLFKDCYDYKMQQIIDQSFFKLPGEEEENSFDAFEKFLTEEKCSKAANLIKIIAGKKFQELDRKLRQELIAIDGATIVDYEGNILAVGAIVKIEAGSSGGGRLAAAKTLSNYGVAMKISNDGTIEGFRMDRSKLRVKPLFVIG